MIMSEIVKRVVGVILFEIMAYFGTIALFNLNSTLAVGLAVIVAGSMVGLPIYVGIEIYKIYQEGNE